VVLQLPNIQSMPFSATRSNQTLGQLLHGFVERLAGAVAVFAQQVVLGLHDARQTPHQHPAFTGQVAVNLFLKGGGKR
jgi:hypothetical protein